MPFSAAALSSSRSTRSGALRSAMGASLRAEDLIRTDPLAIRADAPVDSGAQPSFTVMRRDPTGIVASSNLTPFVGREAELEELVEALERAAK